MFRLLIIWLGTYSIINTDLHSSKLFASIIFPTINVFYLIFLFKEFVRFLYSLRAQGTKKSEVNIIDLAYDVWTLLYEDIADKYAGRFRFLGKISGIVEDLVVPMEIILVVVSFYNELQLLVYLAD